MTLITTMVTHMSYEAGMFGAECSRLVRAPPLYGPAERAGCGERGAGENGWWAGNRRGAVKIGRRSGGSGYPFPRAAANNSSAWARAVSESS